MLQQLRDNPARTASNFGLVSVVVIAAAMFISGVAYIGTAGERYSPVNHWVSELGELGVSRLGAVFNVGLIVGSACLGVYMVGLARTMNKRIGGPFGIIGAACGVAGMLVGIFPMNNLGTHTVAAQAFFGAGFVAVFLFTLYVLFDPARTYPVALALPSLPTVAAFIVFVGQVVAEMQNPAFSFAAPEPNTRPAFWPVAAYEWLVVVFMIWWILLTSLYLRRRIAQGEMAASTGRT